jgi:two-component system, OmpR family, phosphate regulon sensor histidine kinase PhoR
VAFVRADRRALEHVVSNLVDNAVKYAGIGRRVLLSARSDGDSVEFSVQDDGAGIEPKHLPRLFERFYRVDAGRSRDAGGTGLGLAIVKHLVESMQGAVSVRSEVGRGTTFVVRLPAIRGDAS